MLLAITWQWVTGITLVLCLFGAAYIGVAVRPAAETVIRLARNKR
jgi:hypothetical protein